MTFSNSPKKSERGQALIVIAFALVALAGLIALVIDGGNAFLDRRNAQNAADSAALAAALARIRGGQNFTGVALKSAAENGYGNDGTTSVVTVHVPPVSGPHTGDVEYIQVVIVSHVKTYLASIVGWSEFTNEVQAVARSKPSELKQLLNGPALVSLAPKSNCGTTERSFWVHGEITLEITGGGVFVNSNNQNCALVQEGSGKIHLENTYQFNVVGGASIQKAQFLTPTVTVGNVPISYPPPFFMPEVACADDEEATVSANGTTMSPGHWGEEAFPPDGVTSLEPGVYCLDGDFVVGPGRTLTATDVVFNVAQGEINFSGQANISLGAPSSGDFFGLLLYMPIKNNSPVILDGGMGSTLRGTILAPGAKITIIGSSPKHEYHSQIVGYTIEIQGQHKVDVIYKNSENFDSLSMPEVQLSQ
jgi:hypothetical protein